jgi:predicted nucleic acid-binding protein
MNQLIPQFDLRPRDALHVAAMNKCNCISLVSEDSDFDRVPHLQCYTLE